VNQITDPNSNVTKGTYDSSNCLNSGVKAFGTGVARTFTFACDPSNGFPA